MTIIPAPPTNPNYSDYCLETAQLLFLLYALGLQTPIETDQILSAYLFLDF